MHSPAEAQEGQPAFSSLHSSMMVSCLAESEAASKKLAQKRELKAQDEKDKEEAKLEILDLEAKLEAARAEKEKEQHEQQEQQ